MSRDAVTERIIGCAIEVHRHLGPGLLESAYERCLMFELAQTGMAFEQQAPIAVHYKDTCLDCGYRMDLLVQDSVIVELKSVEEISRLHQAQLLTFMKLANIRTGLLINFNVRRLIDGVERFRL